MIKAVLFDMDGVLADSEHLHLQTEKQTFHQVGYKFLKKECKEYAGQTIEHMFRDIIKKHHLPTTFEKIMPDHEKRLAALFRAKLKPVPDVIDLVKWLHKNNYPLAVCSSSPRKIVLLVLDIFKIRKYFQTIVTADEITHTKPHPEIFLKGARGLKTKPENCLVIEDAHAGITAAKRAKMYAIGHRNAKSGNQDLSQADFVITKMKRVPTLIGKINT